MVYVRNETGVPPRRIVPDYNTIVVVPTAKWRTLSVGFDVFLIRPIICVRFSRKLRTLTRTCIFGGGGFFGAFVVVLGVPLPLFLESFAAVLAPLLIAGVGVFFFVFGFWCVARQYNAVFLGIFCAFIRPDRLGGAHQIEMLHAHVGSG